MKKTYLTPELGLVQLNVEQGIAATTFPSSDSMITIAEEENWGTY